MNAFVVLILVHFRYLDYGFVKGIWQILNVTSLFHIISFTSFFHKSLSEAFKYNQASLR